MLLRLPENALITFFPCLSGWDMLALWSIISCAWLVLVGLC